MKKDKVFKSNGQLYRPRGRQPLLVETQKADLFLHHLERRDKKALEKVIHRLYELATQEENVIVATRCIEIILAYGLGKPATIEHDANKGPVQITFTRAAPPVKALKE